MHTHQSEVALEFNIMTLLVGYSFPIQVSAAGADSGVVGMHFIILIGERECVCITFWLVGFAVAAADEWRITRLHLLMKQHRAAAQIA